MGGNIHNCHLLYFTEGDCSQEALTGQKQSGLRKKCRRKDQAFLHTFPEVSHGQWVGTVPDENRPRSYESSKTVFCYRVVNRVIMSPVSLPLSHHRHTSCSSLLLKSMYKKDYPPPQHHSVYFRSEICNRLGVIFKIPPPLLSLCFFTWHRLKCEVCLCSRL